MNNRKNLDLVWAKMRYSPFWPARIVEPPPFMGRISGKKTCVLFFGTKQFGIVDNDKIENYVEKRDKYIFKWKGQDFKNAVKQMDEYMSDRKKYRSNACAKATNSKIRIKTERDVETALGIKKEKNDTVPHTAAIIQKPIATSTVQKWDEEKRKLIDKIATLQSKNQQTILQLKGKEAECKARILEKQNMQHDLSGQVSSLSNENSSLRSELLNIKNELSASKKTISSLKLEKQKLNAVVKQLKTGSTQSNGNHDHDESTAADADDNFYEVEKVLKHKYKKDGLYYLVRWKNYSAEDDTWQKESDFYPKILNEYKRKMKLN